MPPQVKISSYATDKICKQETFHVCCCFGYLDTAFQPEEQNEEHGTAETPL